MVNKTAPPKTTHGVTRFDDDSVQEQKDLIQIEEQQDNEEKVNPGEATLEKAGDAKATPAAASEDEEYKEDFSDGRQDETDSQLKDFESPSPKKGLLSAASMGEMPPIAPQEHPVEEVGEPVLQSKKTEKEVPAVQSKFAKNIDDLEEESDYSI